MQRENIFTYILTVMLLLSFFSGAALAAPTAGEVAVQVKDVSAEAGQTVTAELIMDGSFAAFQGILIYDTGALTLEKIETKSLLSGSMTLFNQDEDTGEFLNGSFISASGKNMVANGAVLTFTFVAGSNANATYSFSLEQLKVYDEKGVELTINPVDTIVIPDSGNPSLNDPGANPDPNNPEASPGFNNPEASPESNNPSANPGSSNPGVSTGSNNPAVNSPDGTNEPVDEVSDDGTGGETSASGIPEGNRLAFLIQIVLTVVVVGIALIVIVSRKKNKVKETK